MQSLKTAILATIIGLGAAYALAWVGPTQAPPLANVPGPINKGSADQVIPNNISLKGQTGTEGLVLKQMFMSVNGMFETSGNTYLATDQTQNAKVGIGTTNPTALLDVGSDATNEYQYQSTEAGLLSPRCDCDVNSSSQDCPTSFPTTDAAGSICYDRDTSSLNLSHKYLSVETAPRKNTLTVTKDGKVGIGTSVPRAKLDVADAGTAPGSKFLEIGDDAFLTDIDVANTLGIYGDQDSSRANIKLGSSGPIISGYNGNVGIGTTRPGYLLDVNGQAMIDTLCLGGICARSFKAWTTVSKCGGTPPQCPDSFPPWTDYTRYTAPSGLSNCGDMSYVVCYQPR